MPFIRLIYDQLKKMFYIYKIMYVGTKTDNFQNMDNIDAINDCLGGHICAEYYNGIEKLYAKFILENSIRDIAQLNLLVREHNINIGRYNVIANIYYDICRRDYEFWKTKHATVCHHDFEGKNAENYISKYWHIFKMFDIPTRNQTNN